MPSESIETRPRKKKRLLVLCDHYLPSTKAGGGMWTIVNLIERFGDRYEFFVITKDHASRNDTRPYKNILTDEWNVIGSAKVFYLSGRDHGVRRITDISNKVEPDGVILNSVFSNSTISYLLARRLRRVAELPVLLAATGELTEGALKLKRLKKRSYLLLAQLLRLYNDVIWKATSEFESREIREVFGDAVRVEVAPDLPPRQILDDYSPDKKPAKLPGQLKLIFLSRIVPKKNLTFALERISELPGDIELTIAGPIEDDDYWQECERLLTRFPGNIKVDLAGALDHKSALRSLTEHHFFVLPTLSENFGYVVLEALAAGCGVLVSDRTYWNNLGSLGAGWIIPLENPDQWTERLVSFVEMDQSHFSQISETSRAVALEWLSDPEVEEATAKVLSSAF